MEFASQRRFAEFVEFGRKVSSDCVQGPREQGPVAVGAAASQGAASVPARREMRPAAA